MWSVSFGLRTVGRDPFDPQFVQGSPELRSQRISPQLFGKRLRAGRSKNAGFIGVMGQGTSVAPYPSAKRSQILFRGVVFGEPCMDPTGSVIDHGDQLAGWTAIPSSQRKGELSCITSSPKLALRSRHTWIFFTR